MAMAEFTHFDSDGNAHMVDVGSKADTKRIAIVKGHIRMQPETLAMITDGTAKKGDVLGVARLAGIMALSTYLPLAETLADEKSEDNQDIPIFMAHGSADPVIPVDLAYRSQKKLEQQGYTLE